MSCTFGDISTSGLGSHCYFLLSNVEIIVCEIDGETENASTENVSTRGWNTQVRKT